MSDLPEPQNIRERWNIERDGDGLRVCFNEHERSAGCRYERFVPESVAREAMDRGRREGLEEAAKLADARVGQGGGRGWNQAMEHIADAIRAAVNPAKGN